MTLLVSVLAIDIISDLSKIALYSSVPMCASHVDLLMCWNLPVDEERSYGHDHQEGPEHDDNNGVLGKGLWKYKDPRIYINDVRI